MREVTADGLEYPETVEVYRISEAAAAIGRSTLTLKRWIREKLIPEPILVDTTYGYRQYSKGELKLIAGYLAKHEQDYEYLHFTHLVTINQIAQAIEIYRKTHL
jgi:DNA-binding transcriptional MerR regulator